MTAWPPARATGGGIRATAGASSATADLAQGGSSSTAAAASSAYGNRAAPGSGGSLSRNRAVSREAAVGRRPGRYQAIRRASSRTFSGGRSAPSARATRAVSARYASQPAESNGRLPYC